jgi:hypothetical protein
MPLTVLAVLTVQLEVIQELLEMVSKVTSVMLSTSAPQVLVFLFLVRTTNGSL